MTTTDESGYRIERDTMGEVRVPAAALWRAQTQRAVENFPISGRGLEPAHIRALAQIKGAAAQVNASLGVLDEDLAKAIATAAAHVAEGGYDDQFPIDVFQTGSGTSTNMNVNEVIATLAQQQGVEVHPNDHVNAAQSSNDTFPSAIHVAAVLGTRDLLEGIARAVGLDIAVTVVVRERPLFDDDEQRTGMRMPTGVATGLDCHPLEHHPGPSRRLHVHLVGSRALCDHLTRGSRTGCCQSRPDGQADGHRRRGGESGSSRRDSSDAHAHRGPPESRIRLRAGRFAMERDIL